MRPAQSSVCRQTMQSYLKDWEKKNRSTDIRPERQESVEFLSRIWDQPVRHNNKVKCLKRLETERLRRAKKQENITKTSENLKKQLQ